MSDTNDAVTPTVERQTARPVFTSAVPIAVPRDAVELLRNCIEAKKDGKPVVDKLRAAMAPICAEAHRSQISPEQLLIAVKELCHSLPEYEKIRGAHERGAFLDSVVRMAIEEYYRG